MNPEWREEQRQEILQYLDGRISLTKAPGMPFGSRPLSRGRSSCELPASRGANFGKCWASKCTRATLAEKLAGVR